MPPETSKLLLDIQRAIERIQRFVTGKTYDDYLRDDLLRSAVERQFEIIGEAMSRLLKSDRTIAERITDFRKIAGFRNALIHGYDSIDDMISWGVITQKLSILQTEVQNLLSPPNSNP
ncbi:MAG TPA: HepT-like ribonuclease domain-containing protein [Phycisphaerae bacterium]|jgi:uncharacterized protein with HEPN domain